MFLTATADLVNTGDPFSVTITLDYSGLNDDNGYLAWVAAIGGTSDNREGTSAGAFSGIFSVTATVPTGTTTLQVTVGALQNAQSCVATASATVSVRPLMLS